MKNPPWTRDELIMALDLYLKNAPSIPTVNSEEILELSDFLNRLQSKKGGERQEKFRNANGVYMKLMNFLRFDPEYKGVGLTRGNKDERIVWDLYSSNRAELRKVSAAIRSFVSSNEVIPPIDSGEEEESQEGQILTRVHKLRERDRGLVRRKKESVLRKRSSLSCEVCDFDFEAVYGERGRGFIECHHTKALSELPQEGGRIALSDLSLVCSNCHRMIHKTKPWLSIEELRALVS